MAAKELTVKDETRRGQQVRSDDQLGVIAWANPSDIERLGFEDMHSQPGITRHQTEAHTMPLYTLPDDETMQFARNASRLLHGFMLDCNTIGAKEAGVNLARGIKEYLAKQQG